MSVGKKVFEETALVKPADKFWPLEAYRKRFGSPSAPRNRHLKHRVCRMSGYKGVLVPSDAADGPWDVVCRSGERAEKTDELSVDSDNEMAEDAFAGCRNVMRKQMAEASVGAVQSILDSLAMTSEEAQKEEERVKRRRLANRRPKAKAGEKEKAKVFKPCGFFDFAVGSDESDEDNGNGREKVLKRVSSAKTSPQSKSAASSGSPAATKAGVGGTAGSPPADDKAVGKSDDGARGRGAPNKSSLQLADSLWQDFTFADEASNFFCKVCVSLFVSR